MQATLLIMCFVWRHRQHKLGIDDFGHPLHEGDERSFEESEVQVEGLGDRDGDDTEAGEDTPLLVRNMDGKGSRWRVLDRLIYGRSK